MKQLLFRLLDLVAWVLGIITVPLRFFLKLVWPSPTPEETGLASEQEQAQAQARNPAPPINPIPPKIILPASPQILPAAKVKPGWFSLPSENLPRPTYWPVVLGLGLIFGVFGVVTSFVFSLVGILLFILGLAGWIGDMWNER